MKEGEDVHQHLNQFFDAVNKLGEMALAVNDDLLTIMLLYSLPSSFENFRCAIESRDVLPISEALKIKIIEESEARKSKTVDGGDAMFVRKERTPNKSKFKKFEKSSEGGSKPVIKCYRCKEVGHIAAKCRAPASVAMKVEKAAESAFHSASFSLSATSKWCIDS